MSGHHHHQQQTSSVANSRRAGSSVMVIRSTTLVLLSFALAVGLFGRTGEAMDLMKLIEQAQRHRALKRASESRYYSYRLKKKVLKIARCA